MTERNSPVQFPRFNRRWRYDHEEIGNGGGVGTANAGGMALSRGNCPRILERLYSGIRRGNTDVGGSGSGRFQGEQLGGREGHGLAKLSAARQAHGGSSELQRLAAEYVAKHGPSFGIPHYQPTPRRRLDPRLSTATADAFDALKHNPQDPGVKAAYDALIRETISQYNHLIANGYKIEPWLKPGQPYRNSKDMTQDVAGKHIWFFPTVTPHEQASFGEGIGDLDPVNNPMVVRTGHNVNGHDLRANDIFHAVHDIYGHAKDGHEFGPEGEYNAWAAHAKMYSPMALHALTTETHGHNSWVNFGKHLRRPDGSLPVRGEPDWVDPRERPFALQKAGILPREVVPVHPYLPRDVGVQAAPNPVKMTRHVGGDGSQAPHLYGDIKGFLLFPSTRTKSDAEAFTPLRETFDREFTRHTGRPPADAARHPLHNAMPDAFGVKSVASSEPLRHDLAASMLLDEPHEHFTTVLNKSALQHAGVLPKNHIHLHGINSHHHLVEPSVATIFHGDVTPHQLDRIAADTLIHSRQRGALSFFPHADGMEQLLHMRVPTHRPMRELSPQVVAEASRKVMHAFGPQGAKLLPSRMVSPDVDGFSDVLAHVGKGHVNPAQARALFSRVAALLGTEHNAGPRYWMGTGRMIGGSGPHDDGMHVPSPAAVVPQVRPHQFAASEWWQQHPKMYHDFEGLKEALLQNPRDAAYPHIMADVLEEAGHPASPVWNWYWRHAIPGVEGVNPVQSVGERVHGNIYRNMDVINRHGPDLPPIHGVGFSTSGAPVFAPTTSHNLGQLTLSALLRKLRIYNPQGGTVLPSIADRVSPDPTHQENLARLIAARELHSVGLLNPDEILAAHSHAMGSLPEMPAGGTLEEQASHPRTILRRIVKAYESGRGFNAPHHYIQQAGMLGPVAPVPGMGLGDLRQDSRISHDVNHATGRLASSVQGNVPEKFARAPAGTGAVIRGVYYAPGKMIPTLETDPDATTPQTPAQPMPPHPPTPPAVPQGTTPPRPPILTMDKLRRSLNKQRQLQPAVY